MDCPQCGGSMSPKQTSRGQVFECNQDNGDCMNDKGYPTSQWPKTRGGFQQQRRQAPPPQQQRRAAPPAQGNDARSGRIERQHSQHMALLYFALNGDGDMPDTKKLRDMVSWFQRDIGTNPARPPQQREPEPEPEPEQYAPTDVADDEVPF